MRVLRLWSSIGRRMAVAGQSPSSPPTISTYSILSKSNLVGRCHHNLWRHIVMILFKVTICDLKGSHSLLFSRNIKSAGKRSILRLTAWLSTRVPTPYNSAKSWSSISLHTPHLVYAMLDDFDVSGPFYGNIRGHFIWRSFYNSLITTTIHHV